MLRECALADEGNDPVADSVSAHHGQLRALSGISLRVFPGEVYAIIGANGAGKSTLLRTIAGLHHPTEGSIVYDGRDVTGLRPEKRATAGIVMVPEGRRLFPSLTLEENLQVGATFARSGPWTIEKVYDLFPWMKERRRQKTSQMSGGEQQSVAIGRALVANPRVLLLDELSLGLAPVIMRRIYGMLPQILSSGVTVLLVEQDVSQALRVATHLQCLLEGHSTLEGRPADVTAAQVEAAYFGWLRPAAERETARRRHSRGERSLMGWVNAIIQGILTGGLYALFACGLSLMFGVMKVVNLAHGDLAVVAAYIGIGVIAVIHIPFLWSVPIVVAIMAALGYVLQRSLFQCSHHPRRAHHADRHVRPVDRDRERPAAVLHGQQPGHRHRRLVDHLVVLDRRRAADRLARRRDLRARRRRAARPAVLPVLFQVRAAHPRRRRRQGGGAAVRGRLPARVRHRRRDRIRHRGARRHRPRG